MAKINYLMKNTWILFTPFCKMSLGKSHYAIISLAVLLGLIMFITLTELRYIVAVAEEKNFGRAAHKSFVSQPTLSIAIKKLEDNLGVQIFERDKKQIIITANGAEIVVRAKQILESVDEIQKFAQQNNDPFATPLKIGAIHTIGPYLFPNLISYINQQKSQLKLIIEEDMTANLSEKLQQGNLDAIIVALPYKQSNIESKSLYSEDLTVIVSTNHPWKNKKHITLEDLTKETILLLGSGHCLRDQVLQICPSCNFTTGNNHSIITSSIETIKYMVASDIGISIVPKRSLQGIDQTFILEKKFLTPIPKREIVLAYRKNFSRTIALEELARMIRKLPQI